MIPLPRARTHSLSPFCSLTLSFSRARAFCLSLCHTHALAFVLLRSLYFLSLARLHALSFALSFFSSRPLSLTHVLSFIRNDAPKRFLMSLKSISVYTCIYVYIYTGIYVYIYIYMYMYMCVFVYAYVYICIYLNIYMHLYTCKYFVYIHICI